MSTYTTLIASLEMRGVEYMSRQRNALRAAYVKAKHESKVVEWQASDDVAFEAIDTLVSSLANEAGFNQQPTQAQQQVLASRTVRPIVSAPGNVDV